MQERRPRPIPESVPAAIALLIVVFLTGEGCRTDAVGSGECRQIEYARCEAAPPCGEDYADAAACKRFYRDHCQHGMRLSEEPETSNVKRCVASIDALGACTEQSGREVPLRECERQKAIGLWDESRVQTACEAILEPQYLAACAWITPEDSAGDESLAEGGSAGAEEPDRGRAGEGGAR